MTCNKHKTFIGVYDYTVILTYIGIIAALLGIMTNNIKIALLMLIVSGICDLFDGPIARTNKKRTEVEKGFGIQIDSLADVIASIVLPFKIVSTYCLECHINKYIIITIGSLYVLCGVIRLAWYNVVTADFYKSSNNDENGNGNESKKVKYYTGLPVTYSALVFPIAYIPLSVSKTFGIIMLAIMLLLGLLYILNIKIPKPRGIWHLILPILAIALSILIIIK